MLSSWSACFQHQTIPIDANVWLYLLLLFWFSPHCTEILQKEKKPKQPLFLFFFFAPVDRIIALASLCQLVSSCPAELMQLKCYCFNRRSVWFYVFIFSFKWPLTLIFVLNLPRNTRSFSPLFVKGNVSVHCDVFFFCAMLGRLSLRSHLTSCPIVLE